MPRTPVNNPLKERMKPFQTYVHPEVLKRLKKECLEEDLLIFEKLHVILCHELGCEDLLSDSPTRTPAAATA